MRAWEAVDILICDATIITVYEQRRILTEGAIAVKDGRILDVGKTEDLAGRYSPARSVEARGKVVIPGLINAHVHLHQPLVKGLFSDIESATWLERIWSYYNCLDEEICYINAMLCFMEMLKSGTTCLADSGTVPTFEEPILRAAEEIGIRGIFARNTMDVHGDKVLPGFPLILQETTEKALAEAETFVKRWNHTQHGRIRACFNFHMLPNVSDELCRGIRGLASAYGVGIFTHAGLDEPTTALSRQLFGLPDIERLDKLKVLGPDVLAVHMGWINTREFDLVKDYGVKVCHCPSSSLTMGYGNIVNGRFPEMLQAGITVALGTDGSTCSNFMDMLRVMYLASTCHKEVRRDPTVMPAEDVLEMATLKAAQQFPGYPYIVMLACDDTR